MNDEASEPRSFRGDSVTVMGLGLFGGGSAVARFLARQGARVTVTDLRSESELAPSLVELDEFDVKRVLGEHRPEDFESADVVVANPAVPPSSEFLTLARRAGARVTSETALFLERCPAPIVAVTGTQGKSSTCHLTHSILTGCGVSSYLGGNIGGSLLDELHRLTPMDRVVLELSSYQLDALRAENLRTPMLRAVAITNVLSDHLERHGSRENYVAAKRSILDLFGAGGTALLPGDAVEMQDWTAPDVERIDVFSSPPRERSPRNPRLWIEDGIFRWEDERLAAVADLSLPGEFQRRNALVALGLARIADAPIASLADALRASGGLPHRCEDLGTFAGHRVWDNGVSTTPDSTVSVMESLAPGFCLLAGGQLKALDLTPLARAAKRASRAVTFGAGREELREAFARAGVSCAACETLPEAVRVAFDSMTPGEALLFSPAAASFDAYSNFRERALDLRRLLREIADS